jgi:hypothetical protein
MKIYATFANRHYAPEASELVCAWDEFCIEGNYEGWEADRQKALDSFGSDLLRHATFEIEVPMDEVDAALNPDAQGTLQASSIRRDPEDA